MSKGKFLLAIHAVYQQSLLVAVSIILLGNRQLGASLGQHKQVVNLAQRERYVFTAFLFPFLLLQ